MRFLFLPLILIALSVNAAAIGVDKNLLPDPAQEARAQHVMKKLRCLVCQNQSIVDSDAGLAADLRAIVREQVSAGKTDAQILEFMTSRYGDWVLLQPPFKASTAVLWISPAILLLIGGGLVFRYVRRRPESAVPAPLNPAEKKRLKQIIGDEG